MKLESKNIQRNKFYPSFSIVIEWENVLRAEKWRTRKMLQQLCQQIIKLFPTLLSKPEVIIVYNPEGVEGKELEKIAKEDLKQCNSIIELKIIPAVGLHYYQQKNFGVQHATHDIIIFIDSDVIPEEGWLTGTLEPFSDHRIQVACGNTHIPPNTILEKAFAWFWSFPPKSDSGSISEKKLLYCSNVAFRREIIDAYPFPELPQFRGQCMTLSDTLRRKGIKIFHQPKSSVRHPVPHGLRNFVNAAICQGHDIAVARRRERKENTLPKGDVRHSVRALRRIFSTLRQRYHHVDLSLKHLVPVLTVILSYYILTFIGIGISSINPQFIRNHFSI